ncbi:UvrB/UvrC motif-containing protein [Brevifollis gellanilyticus]|uniref:UvrB/UvrC motif-containing protein n=1 Tax=Brevifollis gellanilyticus TaxID=748831 RepID=UPI001478222E|nr:UvrB/UvrC motif-containing protein [Brevifollis gellanilyticus]
MFLTQIINGQMTTVNLCDACSKAKGVTDEAGFGLAEAFLSTNAPESHAAEVVCGACGFTASQLKKIGRMGCPECYTAFRDGLDNLLRAMHKGTRHEGKIPGRAPAASAVSVSETEEAPAPAKPKAPKKAPSTPSVAKLREQLDAAVRDERYEDAAAIKKEIDRLSATS